MYHGSVRAAADDDILEVKTPGTGIYIYYWSVRTDDDLYLVVMTLEFS